MFFDLVRKKMNKRVVIRAHGKECEKYIKLLEDFNRSYVISDINPRNEDEIFPDRISWEQMPFCIVGNEKFRNCFENEVDEHHQNRIVPYSYMMYQFQHYKRESFLSDLTERLLESGVKLESCFSDTDEVRMIVVIPYSFGKKIRIHALKICEDGEFCVNNIRKHQCVAESVFSDGIAMVEFESVETELLLELVFSQTDIPYICIDIRNEDSRKDINKIIQSEAGRCYYDYLRISSTKAAIHEEDYLFLKHLRDDNGLIIDCGVNYGQSIRSFIRLIPDIHIIGFEANPELFNVLKSIEENNRNVKLYTKGVSDTLGEIDFYYIPDAIYLSGSFLKEDIDKRINQLGINMNVSKQRVRITTLDNEIDESMRVDFIKLDIEGLEYKALLGAKGIIERDHPLILIENHGEQQNLIDSFLNGYTRYYYDYHDDRLTKYNRCHSINYYMVPSEEDYYTQWIK